MRSTFALEDIFNVMIELESLGQKHYTQLVSMTDDLYLKDLFTKLAVQEDAHKTLYTRFKHDIIHFEKSIVNDEYISYIDAMLKGTVTFLNNHESITDLDTGYKVAINLEKDTILFLNEVKRLVDKKYHNTVDAIIDEERQHLKWLYEYQSK